MIDSRHILAVLVLAALPFAVSAQQKRRDVHIIYKDGFIIEGKVKEQIKDVIYDPSAKIAFPVFSGKFSIDDEVRDIVFGPSQVLKIVQRDVGDVKEPMKIVFYTTDNSSLGILEAFKFDKFSPWDARGERTIQFVNGANKKTGTMTQKFGILTPQFTRCITDLYRWELNFFTREFSPELITSILERRFQTSPLYKKNSDAEKMLKVAGFLQEAGWFDHAEKKLDEICEKYPNDKKVAEEMLTKLRTQRADLFVETMEKASVLGQHDDTILRLDYYVNKSFQTIVSAPFRLKAQDLKLKYNKAKADLEQARAFLKELPTLTKDNADDWAKVSEVIASELNFDTLERLEEFLKSVQQFELERKQKREFSQSPETVLTIGISSWLQGKNAFETDPKVGLNMLRARIFVLEYLRTEAGQKRAQLLSAFKASNKLPIDVITRLVRLLPPVAPHDTINTKIQTIPIADSEGSSYLLLLPPGYHPQRPHPVLMLFHASRDDAEETVLRFAPEAAKRGFILAAPLWTTKPKFGKAARKYEFSEREHTLVLDTLRDLRKRLQVDSDRVFLFGWEDGANMAFDVGLGHPDLFAGVAPMCGSLTTFGRRMYWPNAQYLPFYVMDGDKNGNHKAQMRDLFVLWTREPYASLYVEYKGRGSEWFSEEISRMLHWMSCKKRYTPNKEMGRPNPDRAIGEEFHSTRPFDNRFYWISTDSINERNTWTDHREVPKNFQTFRPASFQANLSVGNKSDKSSGFKIWNELKLTVTGAKQATFWITNDMIDLSKPLVIRANGAEVPPSSFRVNGKGTTKDGVIPTSLETLLEELYLSGDRQRLYVAKVDIKL